MSYLFPSATITFEAALRDLTGGSPKARALAAHALAEVTDPAERRRAVEALIAALEDDRPEVRAQACSSLGELADPKAIPGLVKRLDDGASPVRQNAAISLGTMAHPDAFEPLATALREGPADLRFQAASSLAEVDPKRAFEHLVAALHDKDPQVVGSAALGLGAIPAAIDSPEHAIRAKTALLEQLDQPSVVARFDVAYALAELGDPTGKPVLVAALPDADRAWDAVMALANLKDIEALAKALGDRSVTPEATVLAAGSILRLQGDHQVARRVLLAGLAAKKMHVRGLAVEQLTEVGGAWAIDPLEKLAKSGKGDEILEAIAQALTEIKART